MRTLIGRQGLGRSRIFAGLWEGDTDRLVNILDFNERFHVRDAGFRIHDSFDHQGVFDDVLPIDRQPVIALVGGHLRSGFISQPADFKGVMFAGDIIDRFVGNKGRVINDGGGIKHVQAQIHHFSLVGGHARPTPLVTRFGALVISDTVDFVSVAARTLHSLFDLRGGCTGVAGILLLRALSFVYDG